MVFWLIAAASGIAEEAKKPEGIEAQTSYALGLNIGRGFQSQGIEIQNDVFLQGLNDGLKGSAPLLTDEEMRTAMETLRAELEKKHLAKLEAMGKKNLEESEAFFAANKKEKGVVTLASGLQYKIEKKGTGNSPGKDDTVTVHYQGTLLDGQEFDSSVKRGQPATFKVGGVIAGWTEALQLMKEGAKWRLFIPPHLAYGERGRPPVILPNSALIFDVELLKVN
ncbi:MAG: FKBP-type peptidyl-prolyl cis-trans isomerase [Deltaproteobacteria bacterium]|nr:FKBP-type peptidyl-prolyl cis-trans isomerase [Deltaproteobacteria bacterium]